MIENEQLRAIFLLLRQELKVSDIPSRTTIEERIKESMQDHLEELKQDMQESTLATFPLQFIYTRCYRTHLDGSRSPPICGQTPISHRS